MRLHHISPNLARPATRNVLSWNERWYTW